MESIVDATHFLLVSILGIVHPHNEFYQSNSSPVVKQTGDEKKM